MLTKTMLLVMSVGVLVAFVVPSAQAQQITNSEGEPASEVTAFSSNALFGGAFSLIWECDEVDLTSEEVAVNTEETLTAKGSGTANNVGGGDCTLKGAGPIIKITAIHWHIHLSIEINSAAFAYRYDITTELGPIPCEFETMGAGAAITYTPGSNKIHVEGPLAGGPAANGCPTEGTFSADFTVTAEGEEATIM